MTLSTHYTKDALESIFATAQKAEFMGIISAYREHKIINGKTQPLSEQENYYRHKFLGLMLNERGISCVSFCAVSKTLYKQDNNFRHRSKIQILAYKVTRAQNMSGVSILCGVKTQVIALRLASLAGRVAMLIISQVAE